MYCSVFVHCKFSYFGRWNELKRGHHVALYFGLYLITCCTIDLCPTSHIFNIQFPEGETGILG